jgi:hypothetical protein
VQVIDGLDRIGVEQHQVGMLARGHAAHHGGGVGHRARDLVAAVTDATAAPATYLLHFGENYLHFHALVAARGADIPVGQRGGNILGLRPGYVDRAAAVALVPSVRAAYERTARGAPDRG